MLRVMTLNIWNVGHWRARRDEIVAWIEHLQPDVLCLQEVVALEDGRNQAAWLAERTQRHWVGAPGLDLGNGAWFGDAVLSRWAIDAHDITPLPAGDQDDEGRVLLHARTHGLDVFCTHLNWQYHHGYPRSAGPRGRRSHRGAGGCSLTLPADPVRRPQRQPRFQRDPLPVRAGLVG